MVPAHLRERRGGALFAPGIPRKHLAFWREVIPALVAPGIPRKHLAFCREVIPVDHPLRVTLPPYLKDGVYLRVILME